ncbi:hypothetical protein Efla_001383 [Eimeria flavescens]
MCKSGVPNPFSCLSPCGEVGKGCAPGQTRDDDFVVSLSRKESHFIVECHAFPFAMGKTPRAALRKPVPRVERSRLRCRQRRMSDEPRVGERGLARGRIGPISSSYPPSAAGLPFSHYASAAGIAVPVAAFDGASLEWGLL